MITIPSYIQWILDKLSGHGYEAFVVGGCVRDALLGLIPHDWDVCTSAKPEMVKACFAGARVIETGIQHGTVTVLSSGHPVEITTYRVDGEYKDHRRPETVTFTPLLREDLARRDFTINAMAYHPKAGLHDPFGGYGDLQASMLRCVGNANERFVEDALRILRAIRFASRFSLEIAPQTEQALFANRHLLSHVSVERVLKELLGMVLSRVSNCFLPIFQVVIPELTAIRVETALPNIPEIQFAALLRGLDAKTVLKRLKASTSFIERVSVLVDHMDEDIAPCDKAVRHLLHRIGPQAMEQLCVLQQNPKAGAMMREIIRRGDCYTLSQLAVTGYDMIAVGLTGKDIGVALSWLLDNVMDGTLPNDKNVLLRAAVFDRPICP